MKIILLYLMSIHYKLVPYKHVLYRNESERQTQIFKFIHIHPIFLNFVTWKNEQKTSFIFPSDVEQELNQLKSPLEGRRPFGLTVTD